MAEKQKRISEKKVILLVEDDGYFRFAIATELRAKNYIVISAEDGERAIKMLQRQKDPASIIDLVITDLVMPRKDGLNLCFEIRKLNIETAVLVITGYMSDESKQQLKELECNDYLEKPFTPEQLKEKVEEILSRDKKSFEKHGNGLL